MPFLKEAGKEIGKQLIVGLVSISGIVAIIWTGAKLSGGFALHLIHSKTNTSILFLGMTLAYLLGRVTGKRKWKPKEEEFCIKEKSLIPIGPFKWEVTVFSDKSFVVSEMPYCKTHDMKLIENTMVYACPVGRDCQATNRFELHTMQQQVESIMEAHLRKQN